MVPEFLYFDVGWTLVDEGPAHEVRARAAVEQLKGVGVSITASEFLDQCRQCGALDGASPFRTTLQRLAPKGATLDVPYDSGLERLFAGANDVLAILSRQYGLGVLANQSAGLEARLVRFGIRQFFEIVLGSNEVGLSKPDPAFFEEAEKRAGLPTRGLVMIGDRPDNDLAPALSRGWSAIRIRQGFSRNLPFDAPDVRFKDVSSLSELPEALVEFSNETMQ
jgi:phosphoglycolate phosphatase-like HAD superfamily hydrolase